MQNRSIEPIIVFADGASSGNPGPGGWGALLILPDKTVFELGGREAHTTNNQMELTAVIQALTQTHLKNCPVQVYSDSTYVLNGIQKWIHGWRSRGWVTAEGKPVANQELWQQLWEISRSQTIQWNYVPGHSGVIGNERADEIAVSFSQSRPCILFHGSLDSYPYSIFPILEVNKLKSDNRQKKSATRSSGGKPAYSYLSLVGSIPMRHANWKECEARVKGHSGARFRKSMSPEEEADILQSWGYQPKDLR